EAAAASGSFFETVRRALLTETVASPTAAAPGAPRAPAPVQAMPGAQQQIDRDDLVWLVNEALVEQARRYGFDLQRRSGPSPAGWRSRTSPRPARSRSARSPRS